jgi:hypothetical protein
VLKEFFDNGPRDEIGRRIVYRAGRSCGQNNFFGCSKKNELVLNAVEFE